MKIARTNNCTVPQLQITDVQTLLTKYTISTQPMRGLLHATS